METQSKFYKAKHENEKLLLEKSIKLKTMVSLSSENLSTILPKQGLKVFLQSIQDKKPSPGRSSERLSPLNEWVQIGLKVIKVFSEIKTVSHQLNKLIKNGS